MKAQNLFIAFITLLVLSLGNVAVADDMGTAPEQDVFTVNINSDSAETIAKNLVGVGLSRANAIVAYRKNYGPFYSAEELSAVRGIGMNTIEKNAGKIVVD
ncbi:MAG: competence protein ComEA [Candidatus Azotimanducaceae bacterium]|jgi:competence protein ComEA